LEHDGLHLSQGTLTDGLQRLKGLFESLMPVLYERQMTEKLFHGDETRWEVFEEVEGKTGHRWYLWVMQSVSVVYDRMAPGRGADVAKVHFAKLHRICSKSCWCVTATVPTKAWPWSVTS
jgi:hypothetical protein